MVTEGQLRRWQKNGEKSMTANNPGQKPDPYKVGELLGPQAFHVGDWVVIRPSENRPARVRNIHDTGHIDVILGDGSDPMYGWISSVCSELGYPINSEFWSEYQKEEYRLLQSGDCAKVCWNLTLDELYLPPILLKIVAVAVMVALTTITVCLFVNIKTINRSLDNFWTSFFTSISQSTTEKP
jgi:hypothetical protein